MNFDKDFFLDSRLCDVLGVHNLVFWWMNWRLFTINQCRYCLLPKNKCRYLIRVILGNHKYHGILWHLKSLIEKLFGKQISNLKFHDFIENYDIRIFIQIRNFNITISLSLLSLFIPFSIYLLLFLVIIYLRNVK